MRAGRTVTERPTGRSKKKDLSRSIAETSPEASRELISSINQNDKRNARARRKIERPDREIKRRIRRGSTLSDDDSSKAKNGSRSFLREHATTICPPCECRSVRNEKLVRGEKRRECRQDSCGIVEPTEGPFPNFGFSRCVGDDRQRGLSLPFHPVPPRLSHPGNRRDGFDGFESVKFQNDPRSYVARSITISITIVVWKLFLSFVYRQHLACPLLDRTKRCRVSISRNRRRIIPSS